MKRTKSRSFKVMNFLMILALVASFLAPVAPAYGQSLEKSKTVPAGLKEQLVDASVLTKEQAVFISPSINTGSSDMITVIVELNEAPVVVQKSPGYGALTTAEAEKVVADTQKAFTSSLGKLGVNGTIARSYKNVFNGVALEVPANKVPLLAKAKHVKAVYEDITFYAAPLPEANPYMNDSGPHIGSTDIWDLGFDGTGIKVGVIDTGIDYNHPDLAVVYKGGYDFVDDDADPMEAFPDPNGADADEIAGSSHGTHVAGTVAANAVGPYGVDGVAPKVELYAYRVLAPGGGTTADVIAGIEKSVTDGMDVINLSLGAAVNDPNYPTSVAVNNAMLAGTVVVVANGNDGDGRWTVGSPATGALAISVGNTTPPGNRPEANASTSLGGTYNLKVMMDNPFTDYEANVLAKDLELVYIDLAYPEDVEGLDLTGKAALIRRGDIAFVDKFATATAAGAEAIFIFNSDGNDGYIEHFLGKGGEYVKNVAFNMTGAEGRALAAAVEAATEPVTINVSEFIQNIYPGDELNGSSSRGPVKETFDIKPDVSAPGTSIFSTIPGYSDPTDPVYETAYGAKTGTSMAAPHVAGLAALLLQAHPEWTPFDVKVALSNTAVRIGDVGEYTVHDQGAGRVDGLKALQTPVLAQVMDVTSYGDQANVENITGNINFGTFDLGVAGSSTKTIQLKDVQDELTEATNLTVDAEFTLADTGVSITFSETAVTVEQGGTVSLTTTLNVADTVATSGEYQGYINFKNAAGEVVAHIPFVSYVGEIDQPEGFGAVYQDPEDFSPNGDGVKDSTNLFFEVFSPMTAQALLVWDPVAYEAGFNDGYIGQVLYWNGAENTAPPGFWRLPGFNGVYYDYRTGKNEMLKDGYYTLDWMGWDGTETTDEASFVVWSDVYVDKKAPVVDVTVGPLAIDSTDGTYTFNSSVKELYVDLGQLDKVAVDFELVTDTTVLESGTVTLAADGSFSVPLTTVPEGLSTLKLYSYDMAGNSAVYEQVFLNGGFFAAVNPSNGLAEVGSDYTVSLQGGGIKNIVGAQFEVAYDDTVFTLAEVVASQDFVNAAGENGVVVVKNEDLGYTESGKKRVLVGVAFKDEIDGVSGYANLIDLTFTVKNDLEVVGEYTFDLFAGGEYTFINKDQVELFPALLAQGNVEVVPTLQDITGVIKPEAFLGTDGSLLPEVDASTLGAVVTAVDQNGVVTKGLVNADGTYVIANLSADNVYTVELYVPGHFRSVKKGIKLVTVLENGVVEPTDVVVDFGTLLAGDVNADDVIDIYDVVAVARYFMASADAAGSWLNPKAANGDLNQDGKVNLLDLSFVVKHFGKTNTNVPNATTLEAQLELPNGQTIEDILAN